MLENLQGKLNCGKITNQTVPLLDSKTVTKRIKALLVLQTSPRLSINPFLPIKQPGSVEAKSANEKPKAMTISKKVLIKPWNNELKLISAAACPSPTSKILLKKELN